MLTGRQFLTSAALLAVSAAVCSAQSIAPAHSGTVHYFEGDVSVDGTKLVSQVARFTSLKEQSVLQTGLGRAEILLTPGVLLRVGENSSVKMLDNRLLSTRIEFLSGSAMLESDDNSSMVKDPAVTIVYKDFSAQPMRTGLFEIRSEPEQLRVFKGEAKVFAAGSSMNVKDGNQVELSTTLATSKFDTKEGDELYLWSRDRSAYLSAGNMASARTLASNGFANSNGQGYGAGWNPGMWRGFSGGWYYNSYLGMYSYLPFAGTIYSPFGFGFYNPLTIADVYYPGYGYNWSGAGGARTATTTSVPLTSLSASGTSVRPSLPRLGTTATLNSGFTATPGNATGPLTARSAFNNNNSFNNILTPSSNTNVGMPVANNAVSPMAAAPAAAAPAAAAASAPRATAGRR